MPTDSVNVLINDSDWAWPMAVGQIFRGRNVELLMVKQANEALNVLQQRRIHTAIIDVNSRIPGGLGMIMIRIIHNNFPLLPCILVAEAPEQKLLSEALKLDVFSVINKPVDIELLQGQLHRLFLKRYGSFVFA